MDPKTKALLHQQGAVLAEPSHLFDAITVSVYPPSFEMSVSNQMLAHEDETLLISHLANHIGKNVAEAVKAQILSAYQMSAKDAVKKIYEAKAEWMKSDDAKWGWVMGIDPGKDDSIFSLAQLQIKQEPVAPVTMTTIKDAVAKLKNSMIKDHQKVPDDYVTKQLMEFGIQGHNIWADVVFDEAASFMAEQKKAFPENDELHPSLTALYDAIPGFKEMKQRCPVEDCSNKRVTTLARTIIHLNDLHHWRREEIADWLETTDHDLQFKTPEEVNNGDSD